MQNIISQEVFEQSSVQLHVLGTLGIDKYGDRYRYVQAGAAALVTGNLIQEAAEDTQFRSMVVAAAAAIGEDTISVTLGSTAVTANMFDEGQLWVESSTGIGQQFRIKRHGVASGAAACSFTLDRPLKIALTTSSNVSVRKSAYDGVIQFPTTPTGGAVGVSLQAMTEAYFGWIKSGGDCPVLFDTTDNSAADAQGITHSAGLAGAVKAMLAADVADTVLGWSREVVSVDSTMGMAHLIID
jgi:hypothetical protein